MAIKFLLIFSAISGFAVSEVIPFTDCGDYTVCEINQLRITPCKNQTHCTLKEGSTASISFDFTPKFSSDAIMTGLLWFNDDSEKYTHSYSELPNADGCLYTSCPLEAGKKQALNYDLHIARILPYGKYNFKWKIWTHNDEECCFVTTIELKR